MYDEFYDEPSEFEIQIEEWKDTLRESVKKEYREEMERLRKENAELRDIKKNWNEKIAELEVEKFKLKTTTRDACIDWLCRLRSFLTQCGMPKEWRTNFHQALSDVIKFLEQEPKTGHWIKNKGYDVRDQFYFCSECGRYINLICGAKLADYPYCHCGAKMGEPQERRNE